MIHAFHDKLFFNIFFSFFFPPYARYNELPQLLFLLSIDELWDEEVFAKPSFDENFCVEKQIHVNGREM